MVSREPICPFLFPILSLVLTSFPPKTTWFLVGRLPDQQELTSLFDNNKCFGGGEGIFRCRDGPGTLPLCPRGQQLTAACASSPWLLILEALEGAAYSCPDEENLTSL